MLREQRREDGRSLVGHGQEQAQLPLNHWHSPLDMDQVAFWQRSDGEQINDRLTPGTRPSVVLMNPPFSASHRIEGRSDGLG